MPKRLLAALLSSALSASGAPAWAGPVAVVLSAPAAAPSPAFAPRMVPGGAAAPSLGATPSLTAAPFLPSVFAVPGLAPKAAAAHAASVIPSVSQAPLAPSAALPAASAVAAPAGFAAAPAVDGVLGTSALFQPSAAVPLTAPAARRVALTAQAQAQAAAPRAGPSLAGLVFDGSAAVRPASDVAVPVLGPARVLASPGLRPSNAAAEAPAAPRVPLPTSYKLYLGGLALSSIGQAISTVLIPLFAHGHGASFTALSQGLGLFAVIPGSWLGAWWVRRFGSKSAYVWSNMAMAVMFASLPAADAWLGGVSSLQFLAFSALSGVQYGMLRGVAEQDITVRALGQGDEGLLKKAGAMYYLAVSPVYMAASMAVGWLLAFTGRGAFNVAGALTMAASALPFLLVALRPQAAPSAALIKEGQPDSRTLPFSAYLPYLFFWTMHFAFYYLLSPFFSLEVLRQAALGGWFVGLYSLGNLAFSLLNVFAPKAAARLSLKAWTAFGAASVGAFLWSVLALGSPALALAGVFLMGVGVSAGLIQWKAYYQNRLSPERQVDVFSRLNVATIVLNLLPFLVLYGAGAFFPGVSTALLLTFFAAAATLAGLALVLFPPRT